MDPARVIVVDPHSAGLAVARRLVRAHVPVTMIAEPDRWEVRGRGIESIVTPFGNDGEPYVRALEQAAAGGEDALVLPATDRVSALLVRAHDRLPANLRMFEHPGSKHFELMEKDTANAIASRAGVAVPWTARIHDATSMHAALASAPWPCVVKPIFSHEWRARYGEPYAFLTHNADAATAKLEQPLRDGIGMLLCQYIPGGDDAVEEAIVVRLADGTYPVRFGCHKLRQYPRGFGATALGEASPMPETMDIAQRVLDEAGFVGVAGVEVKRDVETGKRWFLEVNVRLPAQWGLGDACGVEATSRLVAAAYGETLGPQPKLRSGARIVVPDLDLRVCRELLREVPPRRRALFLLRFVRPWIGARERGLLNLRDAGPGIAWVKRLLGGRIRRGGGRTRQTPASAAH
jgi:predicted ATP-grasp superfamily ATP-dependent carboligase